MFPFTATTITAPTSPACRRPPARVSCSLPEVLDELEAGHRVLLFDDGRIAAVVVAPASEGQQEVELEIVQARAKDINLPDTSMRIPALTAKDRDDLTLACRLADLINASFVRSEADIACLQQALANHQTPCGGLVLKIETHQAFLNLPRLLLSAMTEPTPWG